MHHREYRKQSGKNRNLIAYLKTLGKRTVVIVATLALMNCMAGCENHHDDDLPNNHVFTVDDFRRDEAFIGQTVPATIEVRPQEEIEQSGITPEDVLAVYDQLACLTVLHHYAAQKENIGEQYYDLSATFTKIEPDEIGLENTETKIYEEYILPYYTKDGFYGSHPWQRECPLWEYQLVRKDIIVFVIHFDYAFEGELINSVDFQFGVSESDFLPIAEGFNSEPFQLTPEVNEELWGRFMPSDMLPLVSSLNAYNIAYPAFTIDRETILGITDQDLLWALYNAAQNSMYFLNFSEHYNTHHDLAAAP